jgi:hypothetical protein
MGLVRENVYLYDVQVSTCLVGAYEDYSCFSEVSFFVMLKVSKWNRAAIKFCAKLKKAATETFEMLKSACGEEYLSRTSVEWHRRFKERRELLQHEWKGHPFNFQNRRSTKSFKCVWPKIEPSVLGRKKKLQTNRETGHKILVEDLKKKKVCARFVPHLLTLDQNITSCIVCWIS